MARRSSVDRIGHPVRPESYGTISHDARGVWTVTVERPRTGRGFFPAKPTDKSIRENAVRNAHESRSNRCGTCYTQKSLSGVCMC